MGKLEQMTHPHKVCYLLKRFPRLSETFILNEILALERLGLPLIIVSLLPREEIMAHSAVHSVQAPVHYVPDTWPELFRAAVKAHLGVLRSSPLRYLRALMTTAWWSTKSVHPIISLKKFWRAAIISDICRREGVRHVHAHFANTPTAVAEVIKIMSNLPYSFTTHAKDLYLTDQSLIARRIASAEFSITCTQYNIDYVRSFLPESDKDKIHLVYHGIDLSAFAKYFRDAKIVEEDRNASVPVILSVGRLVPKKGMRHLVAACAQLRCLGVPFRCLIVGKGPLHDGLQDQIDQLDLQTSVELVGPMTHDELVDLYGQATVFALVPEITEDGDRDGIPNVLVEAMAARLPVVTTAISGIPEIVEHGRTGFLVEPGDVAAITDALQRLLSDSRLRENISIAANSQLGSRFHSWETTKAIHDLLLDRTMV